MLLKLLKRLFASKRVFKVTKTVRVSATSYAEALNRARGVPATSPLWEWDVRGEADDLF